MSSSNWDVLRLASMRVRKALVDSAEVKLSHGLLLLAEAHSYAQQTNCDLWEFAVEIHRLFEVGLRENELRFLVRKQLIKHAFEEKVRGKTGRSFKDGAELHFTSSSCFVLTTIGQSLVHRLLKGTSSNDQKLVLALPTVEKHVKSLKPIWDANERVLEFGGQIIKHFRLPADNQETILAVFQEEDWPRRIDDPLPPAPEVDEKRRLNDAVKCLNRNHQYRAIHFRGDGTGQGVIWDALTLYFAFFLELLFIL